MEYPLNNRERAISDDEKGFWQLFREESRQRPLLSSILVLLLSALFILLLVGRDTLRVGWMRVQIAYYTGLNVLGKMLQALVQE